MSVIEKEKLLLELKVISQGLSEGYEYATKGFNDHVLLYIGSNKARLDRIIEILEND